MRLEPQPFFSRYNRKGPLSRTIVQYFCNYFFFCEKSSHTLAQNFSVGHLSQLFERKENYEAELLSIAGPSIHYFFTDSVAMQQRVIHHIQERNNTCYESVKRMPRLFSEVAYFLRDTIPH